MVGLAALGGGRLPRLVSGVGGVCQLANFSTCWLVGILAGGAVGGLPAG